MPVHPQVQVLLDADAASGQPPMETLSVERNRELARESTLTARRVEVARTEDRTVPTPGGGVPVRVYWPRQPGEGERAPLLVWFHGGGFVVGDLETADPAARELCAGSGAVVVSVDYPLAPEHPFPAAPEACWAATAWLVQHAVELGADPDRVAVGGDSAGGNLAATTALAARDRGGPPLVFQLLVYPVTDLLGSYPSIRENGEGYGLTASMMGWFHHHYLPAGADPKDPMASPIYARDLSDLPPALVITAEYDPLRDEAEAYAERLRQAGGAAATSRYDGMVHGFFGMTDVADGARDAVAESVAALRQAFRVPVG